MFQNTSNTMTKTRRKEGKENTIISQVNNDGDNVLLFTTIMLEYSGTF
jgi:hypothetical protein